MTVNDDPMNLRAEFVREAAALQDDGFDHAIAATVATSRRRRQGIIALAGAAGAALASMQFLDLVNAVAPKFSDVIGPTTHANGVNIDLSLWACAAIFALGVVATVLVVQRDT